MSDDFCYLRAAPAAPGRRAVFGLYANTGQAGGGGSFIFPLQMREPYRSLHLTLGKTADNHISQLQEIFRRPDPAAEASNICLSANNVVRSIIPVGLPSLRLAFPLLYFPVCVRLKCSRVGNVSGLPRG